MEILRYFCYNGNGDYMECKEIERQIPRFLKNELTGRRLMRFLKHIEKCEQCKEELTIQYLSSEGIARLEEGKTFDLDRELSEYIDQTAKRQTFRKWMISGVVLLEILAVLGILAAFFYALWI
jgi:hypothetical protein